MKQSPCNKQSSTKWVRHHTYHPKGTINSTHRGDTVTMLSNVKKQIWVNNGKQKQNNDNISSREIPYLMNYSKKILRNNWTTITYDDSWRRIIEKSWYNAYVSHFNVGCPPMVHQRKMLVSLRKMKRTYGQLLTSWECCSPGETNCWLINCYWTWLNSWKRVTLHPLAMSCDHIPVIKLLPWGARCKAWCLSKSCLVGRESLEWTPRVLCPLVSPYGWSKAGEPVPACNPPLASPWANSKGEAGRCWTNDGGVSTCRKFNGELCVFWESVN